MAEQAAQKAAELRKQRESWMAQRAVAQERQAVRTEMWEDQPDESPGKQKARLSTAFACLMKLCPASCSDSHTTACCATQRA